MMTLLIHMSCSILYCIVYRINVYVWMSNFLFILIAFLHVYSVCSIIVCFGMFICYTLCTLQKEEIKNIYLSIYLSIYLYYIFCPGHVGENCYLHPKCIESNLILIVKVSSDQQQMQLEPKSSPRNQCG